MAVRAALGAWRGRLLREVLTESFVLALLAGALGLWLAVLGTPLLVSQLGSPGLPIFLPLGLDGRVLGVSAAVYLAATMLFGLWPSWKISRVEIASIMKGAESGSRPARGRWLVTAEVGVSTLLLVGSAIFLGTWRNLITLDAGFDRDNLIAVVSQARTPDRSEVALRRVWQQALAEAARIPGVRGVSLAGFSLFSGEAWTYPVRLPGLMSYAVTRRTRKIGVRMAVGARRSSVVRMILGETLLLVLAGLAAGIAVALALTHFIRALLFGMSGREPETIGLACAAMLSVAVLAGYLPARWASQTDPAATLRYE